MRILRHYTELPAAVRGGVVALGNFDGVHLGHQKILAGTLAVARANGTAAGVMTFEPHPRSVFNPDQPPFRLTPFRIKARLIESLGLDFLVMQHFDSAFAGHSAEQFISEVLVGGLGVGHVIVGYDFAFGHRRSGTTDMLARHAAQSGFQVTTVGPVCAADGEVTSSSRIRDFLESARPREAALLLGRPWEIEGRVEHGDSRGRQLGFPTANVETGEYLRPSAGVYAVRAGIDRGGDTHWLPGVANFGLRPTFGKDGMLLEVHLFDFDGDLYGRHLRVALVDYLRGEQKFDNIEALKHQINQDGQAARRILEA